MVGVVVALCTWFRRRGWLGRRSRTSGASLTLPPRR
jgi:hypothetical protein